MLKWSMLIAQPFKRKNSYWDIISITTQILADIPGLTLV